MWLAFSLLHYYVLIRVSKRCVGFLVFVTLAIACVAVNAWNDVPHAYPDHVHAHAHDRGPCPAARDPMNDNAHALHSSAWTKVLRRLQQQLAQVIYVVLRSGCCCIREYTCLFVKDILCIGAFTCHLYNGPELDVRAHGYANVPGS